VQASLGNMKHPTDLTAFSLLFEYVVRNVLRFFFLVSIFMIVFTLVSLLSFTSALYYVSYCFLTYLSFSLFGSLGLCFCIAEKPLEDL
jgi:hypothetical protein